MTKNIKPNGVCDVSYLISTRLNGTRCRLYPLFSHVMYIPTLAYKYTVALCLEHYSMLSSVASSVRRSRIEKYTWILREVTWNKKKKKKIRGRKNDNNENEERTRKRREDPKNGEKSISKNHSGKREFN